MAILTLNYKFYHVILVYRFNCFKFIFEQQLFKYVWEENYASVQIWSYLYIFLCIHPIYCDAYYVGIEHLGFALLLFGV